MASCFSLTDNTYDVIEEKDLNVERLIFKDLNTLTSGNRHIYSEFASILGKAVDRLNDGQRGVQDKTRADVAALKARVRNLSKAHAESAEINQAIADFEKQSKSCWCLPLTLTLMVTMGSGAKMPAKNGLLNAIDNGYVQGTAKKKYRDLSKKYYLLAQEPSPPKKFW